MNLVERFTVFADYFQFVLMDESSNDDFSLIWTDEALSRMLAVGEQAICPGTLRNVDVSVEVHVVAREPAVNLNNYDHVVEASIRLSSGNLAVMGCTDYLPDVPRLKLPPGNYHIMYLVSGIETIKTEWDPANDLYAVHLRPGGLRQPRLIKHWKQGAQQCHERGRP